MSRKGKKPKQRKDWLGPISRRPTTNDIGICTGCGWRKRVTVLRGLEDSWPIGPKTAHLSPVMIACPVCRKGGA